MKGNILLSVTAKRADEEKVISCHKTASFPAVFISSTEKHQHRAHKRHQVA